MTCVYPLELILYTRKKIRGQKLEWIMATIDCECSDVSKVRISTQTITSE